MDKILDVAAFVGSLRKDSINRKVANALGEVAPAELKVGIVEIGQLPIYNQDDDVNPPAEWTAFRERIRAADAVLFVTPEHNRSVPAALKNALDVGSRPYGKSAWSGKPGAVISASPGAIGGFGANHHLRQSLVFLMSRRWRSQKSISAAPTSCSTRMASSSMREPANSCKVSCRPMPHGLTRMENYNSANARRRDKRCSGYSAKSRRRSTLS